jgi:hypothetical protein
MRTFAAEISLDYIDGAYEEESTGRLKFYVAKTPGFGNFNGLRSFCFVRIEVSHECLRLLTV